MEIYNALEKNWIASFQSSDKTRILQALHEVRNSGSVKILPVMLKLVNDTTDREIRNEIIRLVSEIKSPEAVPMIAKTLNDYDFGDYLNSLIAACWQSGLDFSDHMKVFGALFIRGDYRTALESFTVIEEALPNATEDQIDECLNFLKESEYMVHEEKLPLYRELCKVVENF